MAGISQEIMDDYNDSFQLFDQKSKGYVTTTVLRDLLKYIGYNPTDNQLEQLTIEVDANGSGKIEFDEFVELTMRLNPPEKAESEARIAFNAFDFMGEGFVAANDIKEALTHVMEKAPETDKELIIKHFRLSKNRKIYFQEFKDMITMKM